VFGTEVRFSALRCLLQRVEEQLNPASRAVFGPPRERFFGEKLADMAPAGSEKRAKLIAKSLEGLAQIGGWIDKEADGPFVMGKEPCFADCDVAAFLTTAKVIEGEEEGSLWVAIASAEGGRWKRYLEQFDKWTTVH